jgi:serine protease inhibitor
MGGPADRRPIPQLLEHLKDTTKVVLVNTLYLRAGVDLPVRRRLTTDRPFTTADGTSVDVSTMQDKQVLAVAAGPGWRAVSLPYYDSPLAMYVLLPDGAHSPTSLLRPASCGPRSARRRRHTSISASRDGTQIPTAR